MLSYKKEYFKFNRREADANLKLFRALKETTPKRSIGAASELVLENSLGLRLYPKPPKLRLNKLLSENRKRMHENRKLELMTKLDDPEAYKALEKLLDQSLYPEKNPDLREAESHIPFFVAARNALSEILEVASSMSKVDEIHIMVARDACQKVIGILGGVQIEKDFYIISKIAESKEQPKEEDSMLEELQKELYAKLKKIGVDLFLEVDDPHWIKPVYKSPSPDDSPPCDPPSLPGMALVAQA